MRNMSELTKLSSAEKHYPAIDSALLQMFFVSDRSNAFPKSLTADFRALVVTKTIPTKKTASKKKHPTLKTSTPPTKSFFSPSPFLPTDNSCSSRNIEQEPLISLTPLVSADDSVPSVVPLSAASRKHHPVKGSVARGRSANMAKARKMQSGRSNNDENCLNYSDDRDTAWFAEEEEQLLPEEVCFV